MLYTYSEINNPQFDYKKACKRYLHKFLNQRNEFKKLKAHEKDYAFSLMRVIYDDNNKPAFDLYKIPEAQEYVFFGIFLTYGEDIDSFNGTFLGPYGTISMSQVKEDCLFFQNYLKKWKQELAGKKGPYLGVIYPMFRRKIGELKHICQNDEDYLSRETYCYGVFFYIYYKAKLYFDEKQDKFLLFYVGNYAFIENIYTLCHIFTRHYVPSLNRGLNNTINAKLPYINTNSLLDSLKDLILRYFTVCNSLSEKTEYLLFKLNGDCYIIWLKYKRLTELSGVDGFEVRSFYRCESDKDLSLFADTNDIEMGEGVVCSIPKTN